MVVSNTSRMKHRRALARDKSVNRILTPVACLKDAALIMPYGPDPHGLYLSDDDLYVQVLNESVWQCLAYGFIPSFYKMFHPDCFGSNEDYDQFIETNIRSVFWDDDSTPPDEGLGYTNIFKMLHLAGWKPVSNVVNVATAGGLGDPQDLVIERFGPIDNTNAIYLTIYNNEAETLTLTDVAMYGCSNCTHIRELLTEQEVERSNICVENYGRDDFENKSKYDLNVDEFANKDRYFMLQIDNVDKFGLCGVGNLMGHQMIQHPSGTDAPVNDPEIIADIFGASGINYSLVRPPTAPGIPPKIRLAGKRIFGGAQQNGVIEDKAVMVFKIYLETVGDNNKSGSDRGNATENPYYRTIGTGWSEAESEYAHNETVDYVSSTVQDACALYRIDTGVNGRYRMRVKYPSSSAATRNARYNVHVLDHLDDRFFSMTPSELPAPVLSATMDQTAEFATGVDEDGFVSIGEFEVSGLAEYELATVVVMLGSDPAEDFEGAATLLIADAVKLELVQ